MARRKSTERLNLIRKAILGSVIALIVGIGGYGLLYSTVPSAPESFVEGDDYVTLDDARPLRQGAPIVVAEYFSYGCIHCRNLDPLIEDWQSQQTDGIEFIRVPVAFSGGAWGILSQGYYALQASNALEANHDRIFRAIHDHGKQFVSPEMLAEFVDGHGVSSGDFLAKYNSPDVRRKAARAARLTREIGVAAVPTLVVADRYVVNVGQVGRKQSLTLIDSLITRVRDEAADAQPETAEST